MPLKKDPKTSKGVTFAHVNNVTTTLELLSEFQPHLEAMDINPGLPRNKRERMRQVIQDKLLVFAFGSKKLGRPDMVTMTLETGDSKLISSPPYHTSPAGRKIIHNTLAELIANDVIEESDSPWASPVVLVRQKGKDRFCVDYQKINKVLRADQYPIPRIDDILSQFAGKQYFTTFDANKTFHGVDIVKKDQPKTAFWTHRGLQQFKRMPFGLETEPSVFQ